MKVEDKVIREYTREIGMNEGSFRHYFDLDESKISGKDLIMSLEVKPVVHAIRRAIELERERCIKLLEGEARRERGFAAGHSNWALGYRNEGAAEVLQDMACLIAEGIDPGEEAEDV
jgi:hypothetical protein